MIALALSDAGVLSISPGCSPSTETVSLERATPVTLYVRPAEPGPLQVSASHPALEPATLTLDVRSGPPTTLELAVPSQAALGDCVPASASARDPAGRLLHQRAQQLSLSADAGALLFGNQSCTGAGASALDLPLPDDAPVRFSLRPLAGGPVAIDAALSPSGLQATASLTVLAPTYSFALTPTVSRVLVGGCVTPLRLTRRSDADGGSSPFSAGELVQVTAPGLDVHQSTACTGAVLTQLAPSAGATSVTFSARATTSGTATLTVSEPGVGSATTTIIASLAPASVEFVGVPDAGAPGQCLAASLRLRDATGDAGAFAADSTLTLSSGTVSGTAAAIAWGVDGGCPATATASTTVTWPASASELPIWYSRESPGLARLFASVAGLSARQDVFFPGAPPVGLRLRTVSPTLTVNVCSTITAELIDADGGVTGAMSPELVTLTSADGGVRFSSTSLTCASATDSATASIATGTSAVHFYGRPSAVGTVVLLAQSTSFDAGLTVRVTNACHSYGQSCDVDTPCCATTPAMVCNGSSVCACNLTGCIPRGGFDCGSSNNCCSGVIQSTTCQ